MSITQSNGACPAILIGIGEVLRTSNPQELITPVGAVQALKDPENTRGITIEQLGEGDRGHRKTVRIMHKQRITPDEVGDAKTCDSGTEKAIFEDTFDVTQHKQIIIHKDEQEVRKLCDAYSQFSRLNGADGSAASVQIMADFANDLLMDLDPLRQAINDAINTSIALNIGDFVGGATSKTIQVLKSAADQSVNNAGFNVMRQELKKTGFAGMPILFGGGNMDLALMSLGYGCCNDGGSDFGRMRQQVGFKFYEDYSDFATAYGDANTAIAFMPGTLQLVTYNKYVGSFAQPIGTMERGTIPDPKIPGLRYDIRILPNECGEYYDIFVNLDFDLYAAPTTLFKSGDRLEGVNGVFKFIAGTVS